jgi:hypothetical protein
MSPAFSPSLRPSTIFRAVLGPKSAVCRVQAQATGMLGSWLHLPALSQRSNLYAAKMMGSLSGEDSGQRGVLCALPSR